ncbi:hypothetical protein [Pseudooceanicola sp. 200-1SW]|uniref:hypothetical protein n=1 Tax=Pseudooceanicola sp. 200-1SW TaxID=3425949 RepID=UPI003D7F757F
MKAILAAALALAPLTAAAQGLVVNDIYTGPSAGITYGGWAYEDSPAVTAYPSGANYCPAGLQPVQLGGEVSCGTPNAGGDWHGPAYQGWSGMVDYGSKSPY